jgi:hypothetical protein
MTSYTNQDPTVSDWLGIKDMYGGIQPITSFIPNNLHKGPGYMLVVYLQR